MEKAYTLWRGFQDRLLEPVASVLMLGCTLLALLEIVRRYVFGLSYEWQGDAVTYFILSAVFLYFGISQRHNEHLSVTIVIETLEPMGPRAKRVAVGMRLFASLVAVVFLIALAWWGVPEVDDAIRYESRTESLVFPMWPFLATLVAGFAFMAVTSLFQIYRAIQALRGLNVLEEPKEEEPVPE